MSGLYSLSVIVNVIVLCDICLITYYGVECATD